MFVVSWDLPKHLLLQSSPVLEREQGLFGWMMCGVEGLRTGSPSVQEVYGDSQVDIADNMYPVLHIMELQALYVQVRVYAGYNVSL